MLTKNKPEKCLIFHVYCKIKNMTYTVNGMQRNYM